MSVPDQPGPAEPPTQAGRLRRVLFLMGLDASRKYGSMEEQVYLIAREFQARGGLFVPVYKRPPEPGSAALYAARGMPVEALDLARFEPATARRLLDLVRTHKIEIVHWNFYDSIFIRYFFLLNFAAPHVRHFFTDHNSQPYLGPEAGPVRHSAASRAKAAAKRLLSGRVERLLYVSEFLRAAKRGSASGAQDGLWLHFVNTDRFRPDAEARARMRAALGAGDRFVALVVAHLIPEKGVDVAVRALARLPEDAELWIVGDGPEAAALERLAAELGVQGRVRFLGLQQHVEPYIQAADCLVCPSVWHEAAGLVNIEGLACGLPVVASRVGGIPELVEDGRTGWLFPRGDDEALASRLADLMADPATRERMGREARAQALARFAPKAGLEANLKHYLAHAPASRRVTVDPAGEAPPAGALRVPGRHRELN